jgi:hypothetical protein
VLVGLKALDPEWPIREAIAMRGIRHILVYARRPDGFLVLPLKFARSSREKGS